MFFSQSSPSMTTLSADADSVRSFGASVGCPANDRHSIAIKQFTTRLSPAVWQLSTPPEFGTQKRDQRPYWASYWFPGPSSSERKSLNYWFPGPSSSERKSLNNQAAPDLLRGLQSRSH